MWNAPVSLEHLGGDNAVSETSQMVPSTLLKSLADENSEYKKRKYDVIDLVPNLGALREKNSLSLYLNTFRGLQSSEPKDKIIALLGLLTPENLIALDIKHDYDMPTGDFYRDFAGSVIMRDQTFGLFQWLKIIHRASFMAFHRGSQITARIVPVPFMVILTTLPPKLRFWPAGLLAPGSNILHVHAYVADEVDVAAESVVYPGGNVRKIIMSWFRFATNTTLTDEWTWINNIFEPEGGIDANFEQFWLTLIGDKVGNQCPAPEEYRKHFFTFIFPIIIDDGESGCKESLLLLEKAVAKMTILVAESSVLIGHDPNGFAFAWMPNIRYKKLFVTKGGRMGVGDTTLEPGDQVALLSGGGPVFFVRRSSASERFQFLGDGYVHGLMHGKGLPTDGASLKEIQLERFGDDVSPLLAVGCLH
jgi:hypothetical protein